MKILTRRAMTLVEALLVVLITSFIMGGLYTTLLVGNRSWLVYSDSVILKQEVRQALFLLSNDLREGKNIHLSSSPDAVELSFFRPSQGDIVYQWAKEGEQAQQLIRTRNQEPKVFGRHITEFLLEQSPQAITITLLAQKKSFTGQDVAFELKQKVALRAATTVFK